MIKSIIEKLSLQPHPEGGFFREIYRSIDEIKKNGLPDRYKTDRNAGTSIYYMLEGEQFSSFHKLKSDETWHFYIGSPIILHLISRKGEYSKIILGQKILEDELFQFTIINGTWFAAEVKDKKSYSLVGCAVYPGFDFADFEMGDKEKLIKQFPQHKELIDKFTR